MIEMLLIRHMTFLWYNIITVVVTVPVVTAAVVTAAVTVVNYHSHEIVCMDQMQNPW